MNIQTLVLFLITLFLASSITVDAHRKHHKPCTIMKISSISTAGSTIPTLRHGKFRHQKRHVRNYNYKRNKKVNTITPTTTVNNTPTPVCTLSGKTCDIKHPEACCSGSCSIQDDGSFACCAKIGNKLDCNTKLKEVPLFIHN
ncbi:hypothetical protein RclHR1_21450002 [Rhizophagus clarus]|uniref:Uncharacterized protein n=1 Tax=Rhizophagus clarus TaxID=94130 RepID=A0A140D0B2_9GLOM|nr:hypothetical protein [Rhizophagus clarus]GBB93293.1 hypothetical protein RclHR1_21450002 [Rhizophagus clarus]GES77776.1 hypothetical protein GLOIN_2v1535308 [Rhizophagus clarus]